MKKKIFMFTLLSLLLFTTTPVLAGGIEECNVVLPNIEIDPKIPNTVHTIYVIIKIIIPILLVIFGMLDLMKGIIAQKEEDIKKGQQIFIKRLISAVIVFFVFSIVQLVISFAAGTDNGFMDCSNAFINGVNTAADADGDKSSEKDKQG